MLNYIQYEFLYYSNTQTPGTTVRKVYYSVNYYIKTLLLEENAFFKHFFTPRWTVSSFFYLSVVSMCDNRTWVAKSEFDSTT